MLVKICGIKRLQDALPAIEEGADFLGIILVPNRARTIETDAALELSEYLHGLPEPRPKLVGVVRNQSKEDVLKLKHELNLDYIQLHGSEPEEWLSELPKPIIRRLVPGTATFASDVTKTAHLGATPLIDSEQGGDGKLLNWDELNPNGDLHFVLAGGLTPDNVRLATGVRGCIGVDVSGGVETDGVKDERKVREFIRNAKMMY